MAYEADGFQVQGETYNLEPHLTFDTTPTLGSSNPVTSNGIAMAVNSAKIGTDISVGRTEGTAVGLYSIAYGNDNTATAESSIVFGAGNRSMSKWSITSGSGNYNAGGTCNIVMGLGNYVTGDSCCAFGSGNSVGLYSSLMDASTVEIANEKIYIGYYNPQTKKLYYDPGMESEYTITFYNHQGTNPGYGTTYVLDLTDNSAAGRTTGDIYYYDRSYRGIISSHKVLDEYVRITDHCHNGIYSYRGKCYYDSSTGNCYADEAMTQNLENLPYAIRPRICDVYFDVISGEFVSKIGNLDIKLNNSPAWIKVNVHYFSQFRPDYTNRYGRYTYLDTDRTHAATYGHAYSDPELSNDITDRINDGEIVIDYLSGYAYLYRCTSNKTPAFMLNESNAAQYMNIPIGSRSLSIGSSNYTTGSVGSIISGQSNYVTKAAESSFVCGVSNQLSIGYGVSAPCRWMIVGSENVIKADRCNSPYGVVMGEANSMNSYGSSQNTFIIGHNNSYNPYEHAGEEHITGFSNSVYQSAVSHITGRNNSINMMHSGQVNGAYNSVGIEGGVSLITKGEDGIWTGTGVSYNPSTGLYTYQTGRVYAKIARVAPDDTQPSVSYDRNMEQFISHAISTDGHTLTDVTPWEAYGFLSIYGNDNTYTKKFASINNNNLNSQSVYMIGSYNSIMAANNIATGLIGYHLEVNYPNNDAEKGVIFAGSYNSMDGVGGARLIFGIGDSETRKNGFSIYKTGAIAAPSCPDTVNEVVSAMANTGISANKAVVTYGMLQDYAPKNGGAVGKPSVTIITLSASGWVAREQTVSVPGISSSSVVIVQPSGSPRGWYTHEVYLDSQGTDELTFVAATDPENDISVKVVYWA